ncbi:MAG: Fe-S cluster assembly protein SufD [Dongiaceae bacterium]
MAELAPAIARQWAAPRPGEAVELAALRNDAMARFERQGLPTPRVEAWRYTRLANMAQIPFAAPANDGAPVTAPAPLLADALRILLVNGRLRPDLAPLPALPAGLAVRGITEALAADPALAGALGAEAEPMVSLNAALLSGGVLIELAPGTALDRPIELVSVGSAGPGAPVAFHPRHLLRLGEGSALTLLESHVGSGAYWSNPVLQAELARGARLTHLKLQEEAPEAFHIAHGAVRLAAEARYDALVLQGGAALARHALRIALDGAGAACSVSGLYLGRGRQHLDNTLEVIHAAPGASSRQLFKGVLADRARGVFQGRIVVERGAQKSDGQQLCRTLLLSDQAEIDIKPELEIYADDVKCSHGATAGDIDDDALFYLRARGIDRSTARRMLIEAFFGELLDEVEDEPLRLALGGRVRSWLAGLADEESR